MKVYIVIEELPFVCVYGVFQNKEDAVDKKKKYDEFNLLTGPYSRISIIEREVE